MEGREGSYRGQSRKEEEREWGSGTADGAQGPIVEEQGSIWIFLQGPESLITPLLMEPVCLLSQGRLEEPVRPDNHHLFVLQWYMPQR